MRQLYRYWLIGTLLLLAISTFAVITVRIFRPPRLTFQNMDRVTHFTFMNRARTERVLGPPSSIETSDGVPENVRWRVSSTNPGNPSEKIFILIWQGTVPAIHSSENGRTYTGS